VDRQPPGDGQPRLFNLATVPAGEPILKYANTIDRPLNGGLLHLHLKAAAYGV
jgi:hypothetical protein